MWLSWLKRRCWNNGKARIFISVDRLDPQVLIEQRLDFPRWVENGFGTGDCVIVTDDVLQVIDHKHGLGG